MPTQQTFLGASIANFNGNIGWGNQSSQLTVTLVEDKLNGDSFTSATVGTPQTFSYDDFTFRGLVQSVRQKYGESGNPVYDVVLVDPREILDGVILILNGYHGGTASIPNLYNVFGVFESSSVGNAYTNETGMLLDRLLLGMHGLFLTDPLVFNGHTYGTIYSDLGNISSAELSGYRIPGDTISYMDLIDDVCTTAGYDYHITLSPLNYIIVNTINRKLNPVVGAIDAFVTSQNNVISKDNGIEFRNEPTSKFLVGGQVEQLYLSTGYYASGDVTDPNTADIWPYWGTDDAGNVILGHGNYTYVGESGVSYSHTFTIDTRSLNNDRVGETYTTDVTELKAAVAGEDIWHNFLIANDKVSSSIHNGKARDILLGLTLDDVVNLLPSGRSSKPSHVKVSDMAKLSWDAINRMKLDKSDEFLKHKALYELITNYAEEYYGRKFMVKLPSTTEAAFESDTERILYTHQPIQSAYFNDAYVNTAIADGLMPSGLNKFRDAQDKIYCYVRFTESSVSGDGGYDVADLSPDTYVRYDGNLFLKCSVDENPVFIDVNTLSDPRAVITLPGKVKKKDGNDSTNYLDTFTQLLNRNTDTTKEFASRPGADSFYFNTEGKAYMPELVALPVRDLTDTYGPWYANATGKTGKASYDQDDTLVPWNYGGFTMMNAVGNASVNAAISYQTSSENGTIVVAGSPTLNIGDQLVVQSGYPYITDINVDIGANGVTTTYNLQTWTPRFGSLAKYNIKRAQREARRSNKHSRDIRSRPNSNTGGNKEARRKKSRSFVYERSRHSSTSLLFGEVVPTVNTSGIFVKTDVSNSGQYDGDPSFTEVAMSPFATISSTLGYNYERMGMCSLDAVFRPFSVSALDVDSSTSGVIMPYFHPASGDADFPTNSDLNPYAEPHDMAMFIQGSTVPSGGLAIDVDGISQVSDGSAQSLPNYRPMGLRAPLVLVGWGYDTNGNPVPGSGGAFIDDYRRRQDLWKAGPLDARWDDSRKVWTATGGTDVKTVRMFTSLLPGGYIDNIEPVASGNYVTGNEYNTIGAEVIVTDPTYSTCALSGELIKVISHGLGVDPPYNIAVEPVSEFGLYRTATLQYNLPAGSYAYAVFNDNTQVKVYSHLLQAGQIITGGSEITVFFDRGRKRWYVNGAQCVVS